VGKILAGVGVFLFILGIVALGKNITPLPHPKENAELVVTGPYRFVRHPIYGGLILIFIGYALIVHGWLTLLYAALLFIVFDLKSRKEEEWLQEKFPNYTAYSRRVPKLIPFLY
jgi:protein-S-isoprenylcysteine O-methyltransferase Ste14